MVDPRHQGEGIGGKLLTYRLELLKLTPKIKKIKVRTTQLTHEFYAKYGFALVNTQKDYWAKGLDLYEMETNT